MISRLSRFALFLMLLASGAPCLGAPSSDMRDWKAYRITVGDHSLSFSIPPGESAEFPHFDIPRDIDVERAGLFDKTDMGPVLLNRHWDYKSGRNYAVAGTLHAYIVVWRSKRELVGEDDLKKAFEETSELLRMDRFLESGTSGALDPMSFESVSLGEQPALLVHHRTVPDHYLVGIGLHEYLTINVNAFGSSQSVRADGEAARRAILASIKIH